MWVAEWVWHTEMFIGPLLEDVEGAGFWEKMAWVLSKVATFLTSAHRGVKEATPNQSPRLRVHELADKPCTHGVGPFPFRFLKSLQLFPGSLHACCLQGLRCPTLLMTTLMSLRKD